jgi:uncharacterized repeat protein (TIGR03803 family)
VERKVTPSTIVSSTASYSSNIFLRILKHSGEQRLLMLTVTAFAIVAAALPAVAQTETVLHNFNGKDGSYPFSRLIIDMQGNLYGTNGGNPVSPPTAASVIKLDPTGKLTVLYRQKPTGICGLCIDNLLQDTQGNLYGTDASAGQFGNGAVFKVTPSGSFTVLYSFTGGSDGQNPNDGLVADEQGNFYGTTGLGGAFGQGVVFKVTPAGAEEVLYSFTGGSDGGEPWGRLLRDSQGNLLGTTYADGGLQLSFGVVFKLTPAGVESVLHSFTGSDGGHPNGDLIFDSKGNLYGTTPSINHGPHGTVFRVTQEGVFTTLHTFSGSDGFDPRSGVLRDASGNLFGTTFSGGASGDGVAYELASDGVLTVLHNFSGGSDGSFPVGGLVFDQSGNLYGTTAYGGTFNDGLVFKLAF